MFSRKKTFAPRVPFDTWQLVCPQVMKKLVCPRVMK
jgi:hypothetical protein